ncbi:hypothetical protein MauCBS54593_005548 [Microsporum audouinii]
MLFLIIGIQIFAGIGALTAASRCTYAFARDGAIPGSRVWKQYFVRARKAFTGPQMSMDEAEKDEAGVLSSTTVPHMEEGVMSLDKSRSEQQHMENVAKRV